jgi:hypothetical protein
MSRDVRKSARIPWTTKLTVSWTGRSGNQDWSNAESVNLSAHGMRFRMKTPLEVRSLISLRCQKPYLQGSASVRSCIRENMAYLVGVEFTGGLVCKVEALSA